MYFNINLYKILTNHQILPEQIFNMAISFFNNRDDL
jgi:hypothetical protein